MLPTIPPGWNCGDARIGGKVGIQMQAKAFVS
jgi:hypothetical protein